MALNAKKIAYNGGNRPDPLPVDNYPARVVQVIDLGLHPQKAWEGQEKPPANHVRMVYELSHEFLKDENGDDMKDKPRWISEEFPLFNLSSERAKSTSRYMAIDPTGSAGGDFTQLVGMPCVVAVVNNEKAGRIYNNVGGVSGPIKGMEFPDLVNDPLVFELDNPDMGVWASLPDWLKEKITSNLEYEGSALKAAIEGGTPAPEEPASSEDDGAYEEDVPF